MSKRCAQATGQKAENRADLLETSQNPFLRQQCGLRSLHFWHFLAVPRFDYEVDKADKAEGLVLDAKMREPRT